MPETVRIKSKSDVFSAGDRRPALYPAELRDRRSRSRSMRPGRPAVIAEILRIENPAAADRPRDDWGERPMAIPPGSKDELGFIPNRFQGHMPLCNVKQYSPAGARTFRLSPLLKYIRFFRHQRSTCTDNEAFLAEHPDFDPPPLRWMRDTNASAGYRYHRRSGQEHARAVMTEISNYSGDGRL